MRQALKLDMCVYLHTSIQHQISLPRPIPLTIETIHVPGRTILQHLSEVGSYEQQNACRQQLEDVQGSLRFVKYELDRKGGGEAELPALQLNDIQVPSAG